MKCPRCWADKAYLHRYRGWQEKLLGCLAFRPMKCHHCYHRFMVHWVLTLGKRVEPPVLRVTPHPRTAGSNASPCQVSRRRAKEDAPGGIRRAA